MASTVVQSPATGRSAVDPRMLDAVEMLHIHFERAGKAKALSDISVVLTTMGAEAGMRGYTRFDSAKSSLAAYKKYLATGDNTRLEQAVDSMGSALHGLDWKQPLKPDVAPGVQTVHSLVVKAIKPQPQAPVTPSVVSRPATTVAQEKKEFTAQETPIVLGLIKSLHQRAPRGSTLEIEAAFKSLYEPPKTESKAGDKAEARVEPPQRSAQRAMAQYRKYLIKPDQQPGLLQSALDLMRKAMDNIQVGSTERYNLAVQKKADRMAIAQDEIIIAGTERSQLIDKFLGSALEIIPAVNPKFDGKAVIDSYLDRNRGVNGVNRLDKRARAVDRLMGQLDMPPVSAKPAKARAPLQQPRLPAKRPVQQALEAFRRS